MKLQKLRLQSANKYYTRMKLVEFYLSNWIPRIDSLNYSNNGAFYSKYIFLNFQQLQVDIHCSKCRSYPSRYWFVVKIFVHKFDNEFWKTVLHYTFPDVFHQTHLNKWIEFFPLNDFYYFKHTYLVKMQCKIWLTWYATLCTVIRLAPTGSNRTTWLR